MRSPRIQLHGNLPTFDIFSELELTRQSLKKRKFILKVTFLVPPPSRMLKLPRLCEMVVNEIEVVYCSWQSAVSYCFSFYDARENVMGVVWRKMRVHVLMVWFLVDLLVDYMVSDGEMVEWQGEIQVMSGMVIWWESVRYLMWVWAAEIRNNVR